MLDTLHSAASFVVAIGVLVAFHEFGHFWVARRFGIKVLKFSIGFGKPLWSRRAADGVEYQLAMIPLGGYVKLLDEREADVVIPPEDLPRAFNRQSVGKRIAVFAAGPAFNFILAIAFYWALYIVGVPGMKPVIAEPVPGSLAAKAGLVSGDRIVKLDEQPIATWSVLRSELLNRALSRGDSAFLVAHADNLTDFDVGALQHAHVLPGRRKAGAGVERDVKAVIADQSVAPDIVHGDGGGGEQREQGEQANEFHGASADFEPEKK